jgi:hypothetical protein
VAGSKVALEGLLLLEAVAKSARVGTWVVPETTDIDSPEEVIKLPVEWVEDPAGALCSLV